MADWTLSDGDICFVEIPTDNHEASKKFYGEVFGWQFNPVPNLPATMFTTSENGIIGWFGRLDDVVKGLGVAILVQSDLAGRLEKVKQAGGEVVVGVTAIGEGLGSYAVIRDPAGSLIMLSTEEE